MMRMNEGFSIAGSKVRLVGFRRRLYGMAYVPDVAQPLARAVTDSTASRPICERLGVAPDADPLGSLVQTGPRDTA